MRSFVITGVSRGLGEALFERLAAGSADRVTAVGRSFTARQRELATKEPGRVTLHEVDLTGVDLGLEHPMQLATRDTAHAYLILNAGMVEPVGAVGSLPPADVAASVAVNLTAPMLAADAFVRALPERTPATVLFISSGAAVRAIEGWAVYCAAKAGAEMFFQVLAEERPGLRVVSVNPGRMDTGMQEVLRRSEFPTRPSYVEAHENGELASPDDVAARVISEHITGG